MQMSQYVNPYEPPLVSSHGDPRLRLPVLPMNRWHEIAVRVASVDRGWCKCRIVLTGSIDADIEYDPRGIGERVYVNGRLIVTTSGWGWRLVTPHIDFLLESVQYSVPASIDVKASFWRLLRTTVFRLTVAGQTVYKD